MDDTQTVRMMTNALRMLDKTIDTIKLLGSEQTEDRASKKQCPVCEFAYEILEQDLKMLGDVRVDFISKSRALEHDEKIALAAKVQTLAEETSLRYALTGVFLELAHKAIADSVFDHLVEMSIDNLPSLKKALQRIMQEAGVEMHEPSFDPAKAN